MKKVQLLLVASLVISSAVPVIAATEGRVDDSHVLTYIFLALCGLIILFQLVPVVSVIKTTLKRAVTSRGQLATEKLNTASKYR